MTYQTKNPAGVKQLLADASDAVFVDVRSVQEFEQGHVPGAFNVPLLFKTANGMQPNPDFLATVRRHFGKERNIVFGWKAGGRSQRACELMEAQGYTQLVNMAGGFLGATDEMGRVVEPGWAACGFETSRESLPGRSWTELSKA